MVAGPFADLAERLAEVVAKKRHGYSSERYAWEATQVHLQLRVRTTMRDDDISAALRPGAQPAVYMLALPVDIL